MPDSKGTPTGDSSRRRASRRRALAHPGVWLATLSTVVGIATGMFTLRDQVFPGESDDAEASLTDYRAAVGKVCAAVNDTEAARAENSRLLGGRLRRAHTTLARRDLLLEGVNIVVAGSGDALAKLGGQEPPAALAPRHQETVAALSRNLDLVLGYRQALDAASTPRRLAAAIEVLAAARPALAHDGVAVRSGLVRLGGEQCRLQPPIATKPVTLPGLGPHDVTSAKTAAPRVDPPGMSGERHPSPSSAGPSP